MLQQVMSSTHVFFYKLSGGRIGGRLHRVPVLLRTTLGRKTGRKRTTPLLYIRDGNRLVIVASNSGRTVDPNWWRNLKHNPIAIGHGKDGTQTSHSQCATGTD